MLSFASTVFGLAVLVALIAVRFGPKLQRVVESASKRCFVQALIFVPVLLLTLSCFELPLEIYGHHISLAYGLSVQGWGSWLADWAKAELLILIFATLTLWGLYTRHSPRSPALVVLRMAVYPAHHGGNGLCRARAHRPALQPLRSRLAKTNPELTAQLRSLAHSAGLDIPESRIFLMHASDKVTTYNAYVTGFGATKRIVVWDTTARDLTRPQTLFIFGHEMGHYVLHHIYLGLAYSALLLFAGLWLTQRLAEAALARWGPRWQIRVHRRLGLAAGTACARVPALLFR